MSLYLLSFLFFDTCSSSSPTFRSSSLLPLYAKKAPHEKLRTTTRFYRKGSLASQHLSRGTRSYLCMTCMYVSLFARARTVLFSRTRCWESAVWVYASLTSCSSSCRVCQRHELTRSCARSFARLALLFMNR